MRTAHQLLAAALMPLALAACRGCESTVSTVPPAASLTPRELRFGKVKVGAEGAAAFTVAAVTQATLMVEEAQLSSGSTPGGAEAFTLGEAPTSVSAFEEASIPVTFRPAAEQAYEAVVSVRTNDPETPVHAVLLTGEGALPHLVVTPQCDPGVARCIGLPPAPGVLALDFGAQPRRRVSPVPGNRLPSVALVNEGDVELLIGALRLEGPDAAAFSLRGAQPGTSLALQGGEGVNVQIEFTPTSEVQAAYAAELVITSDDPAHPEVRVSLAGALRPNRAPAVCANVVQVKPGDGALPVQHDTAADWAPLLVPPADGYDFTATREVVPLSEVKLSALSSVTDAAACTADEEDPRDQLTFRWELLEAPAGSATGLLSGASTSVAVFRPVLTGDYRLRLTVMDTEQSSTSVTLRLR
ncbi:MAG: choice-of-anchor D domain-containing protein, partial [Deltaproteobacteria bacterium]|nr:choice-of-anchor D domain-containing protein [Deltaproteobacteria bacterium]